MYLYIFLWIWTRSWRKRSNYVSSWSNIKFCEGLALGSICCSFQSCRVDGWKWIYKILKVLLQLLEECKSGSPKTVQSDGEPFQCLPVQVPCLMQTFRYNAIYIYNLVFLLTTFGIYKYVTIEDWRHLIQYGGVSSEILLKAPFYSTVGTSPHIPKWIVDGGHIPQLTYIGLSDCSFPLDLKGEYYIRRGCQ